MIKKESSTKAGKVRVTFELPSTMWAESVYLVGDFNNWDQNSMPMMQSRADAAWHITLELDKGREYQFRYLVNGTDWHNDWHADKYVPNQYGSDNSVVVT